MDLCPRGVWLQPGSSYVVVEVIGGEDGAPEHLCERHGDKTEVSVWGECVIIVIIMKVGRESETVADKVVQGECAVDEGCESEEKLGEPDDEEGWEGDVDCALTSYVFDDIVSVTLDDVVC